MARQLLKDSCVKHRYSSDSRESYDHCGYDIVQLSDFSTLQAVLDDLEFNQRMETSVHVTDSFKCGNGSGDDEYNIGRKILNSSSLHPNSKLFKLIKQLKVQTIIDVNNQMSLNLPEDNKFTFSVLKSYKDKLKEPQHLHTDDVYDYEIYEKNNVLMLVALQNDTQFCLVKGSHLFETIAELEADSSDKTYRVPYVIHLQKGEVLVFNMKMLHCGWTTDEDNTRVHFTINYKSRQSITSIPLDSTITKFSGEAKELHHKLIRSKGLHKRKTEIWLNNFGDKRKFKPNM
jgi:hypothetical protein